MAHLYSNENFPLPVVEALRRLGHNVLTTQETGNANQAFPDEAVLAFTTEQGCTVLTINRKHFIRLHKVYPNHADIIVCSYDPDFISQARRIHETIEDVAQLSGKLIRVNRPSK